MSSSPTTPATRSRNALPGRTIDNTKPTAAIANPGTNLRLTVTLGGTADDVTAGVATVAFEYDNGGGWQLISTDSDGSDGWSASLNTTLPATPDGLYAFRLTATDRAGNQETSQIGGRRIDNTAPTASFTDPGPYLMGAVQLSASATDGGSGIDVVRFERSPAGSGGPWTQVGPDASLSGGSWRTTWNTNPDGLYDLRVVVDDLAGNRTIDVVASRRVDNTAPVTTDDAAPGRHNTDQTVTLSRSDAGSGPSATQYRVRPPGGSFGAWLSGTSVTILASAGDGVWTIEYFSTDAAGNVESVKSTDVLIDTTGPTGTVTDPSSFLRGLVTLTATADDPTDVSSVKFEYAPAGTSAWTQIGTDLTANGSDEYTIDWDTTTVADIAYDLQVTFLDSLGNPTVQSLAGKTVDNELPTIALTAPPAGAVRRNVIAITANAADGVSGMREVRFEVKPAGAAGFSQVDVDNGSSPYSTAWDSTASPDGPTDLRVIAVDQAGNLRSATTTIFVDNDAPTLTVSAPSTAVSGTVTLTATGSSDIQSVVFKVGGSPIGTDNDGLRRLLGGLEHGRRREPGRDRGGHGRRRQRRHELAGDGAGRQHGPDRRDDDAGQRRHRQRDGRPGGERLRRRLGRLRHQLRVQADERQHLDRDRRLVLEHDGGRHRCLQPPRAGHRQRRELRPDGRDHGAGRAPGAGGRAARASGGTARARLPRATRLRRSSPPPRPTAAC